MAVNILRKGRRKAEKGREDEPIFDNEIFGLLISRTPLEFNSLVPSDAYMHK